MFFSSLILILLWSISKSIQERKKHTLHNAFYNQKEPNAKQNLTVFFRKFRINAGAVTATVSGGNRMNIKVTRSINYLIYSNV